MQEIKLENLNFTIKNKTWYNPNNANVAIVALAYIAFLVSFLILDIFGYYIFEGLRSIGIKDYFALQIIALIISQGIILLIVVFFSKIAKINCFQGGGFVAINNKKDIFMSILLIISMLIIFIPLTQEFIENIYEFVGGLPTEEIPEGNGFFVLIYAFVLTPLLPAICEELLFRGIIMRGLLPLGKIPAIILSSLMFSLAHGSFQQMLYQFLVGIAIATIVITTKNIAVGMIMHFCNNFFASVISVLLGVATQLNLYYMLNLIFTIIAVVFLIISGIYFIKLMIKNFNKNITINNNNYYNNSQYIATDENKEKFCICSFDEEISLNSKGSIKKYFYYNDRQGFVKLQNHSNKIFNIIFISVGIVFASLLIIINFLMV